MEGALALAPGTVFARDYRVERPLAEGGMGAVYVAVQISTGRKRALKLMHPLLAKDEDARRRFLLEARVGAKIASEHLVEVQAAGVDAETGAPYLVMELLDGEDLATRLQRGAMTKTETRELFRQLCHALAAAHAQGIVHRDLKPANVFLARPKRVDGAVFHVKVLDFGIAKLTEGNATMRASTQPGAMIGTPLWMAPEQSGGAKVTPATDVWALGLILYDVVTGRCFWRTAYAPNAGLAEIFRETLVEPIPSPRARAAEQRVTFPRELEPIVEGSVAREPSSRYADAAAFFRALDAALSGASFVPPPRDADALAHAPTAAAAGLALDATVPSESPLELAFEPSRARSLGPPPNAETLAEPSFDPPAFAAREPRAAPRPLLADPAAGPTIPRWAIFVGLLVVAGVGGIVAAKIGRGDFYSASCPLCTIESGTTANGPTPIGEIRHAVEERFPRIREACVLGAKHAGKVVLRFEVQDGAVRGRPGFQPVNEASRCIADQLATLVVGARGESFVFDGRGAVATERPTRVVYTMEYDPKQ